MSEWIRCDERLPPDCESVLIYTKHMPPISACLTYSKNGDAILYHINDWDESDQLLYLDEVSHWMPLPEPPND